MFFKRRLRLTVFVANFFVVILATFALHTSRQQHEARVKIATQNLAQSVSGEVRLVLEKVDLSLQSVKDEIERQLAQGKVDPKKVNQVIATRYSRLKILESMRMANAAGDVVYGVDIVKKVNISDRDYFLILKENPQAEMVFARPVLSRMSNKWVLNLARRINDKEGAFAGVLFAQLTINYFVESFSKLALGEQGVVSLRDANQNQVARFPDFDGGNEGLSNKSPSIELAKIISSQAQRGTYFTEQSSDGFARMASYEKVGNYPLYLVVGRGKHDYLKPWNMELFVMASLVLLFGLASLFAAVRVQRSWDQSQLAMSELQKMKDTLEFRVRERTAELEASLGMVKKLEGLLPICAYCKKIRDKDQNWSQLESYISNNSAATFSHGICPDCKKKAFEGI